MSAKPELVVEFVVRTTKRKRIDLIGFFDTLNEAERHLHEAFDMSEHDEHEGPILTPLDIEPEFMEIADEEIESVDTYVRKRPAGFGANPSVNWTEADYESLLQHVEWMRPPEFVPPLSPEEVARIPGPLDTPMFDVS